MATQDKLQKIGLSGFRYLYFRKCWRDCLKSLMWSLLMTIFSCIAFILSSKTTWDLLLVVLEIDLRITAPILAFTLAGYSVIMGKVPEKLKTIATKSGLSMYQKLNTTFIAMLLATITNLLLSVFTSILMATDINFLLPYECMASLINKVGLFVITMLLFYMIFTIKDLISNLFSLGQYLQYKG